MVTFGSQVGSQRVSVAAAESTSLHARWRQVPGVGIRLIGVQHQTVVDVQRIGVDEHAHDAVGGCVDGLDER